MENFPEFACEKFKLQEECPTVTEFYELEKSISRTWRASDSRRHWEMMLHCERAMFPCPLPNLPLPSKEARFYWHLLLATGTHEPLYQKTLNTALISTIKKVLRKKSMSKNVMISEQLVRLKSFDHAGRKCIVNQLEDYIRQQVALESLSLEGLLLKREEGLRLVLALWNSRNTMRHLHCWRAFEKRQGPLLVDTGHFTGSGLYTDRVARHRDWFRAISCMEFLTTLSVNYAYIATPTGDLLIALSKKLGSNWQWLQLLCLESEIPVITDPHDGVGGYAIPDIAWRETRLWAPALKVQYVFVGISEYDRQRRFFTKHTPIHTFVLSADMNLCFRQPWFIDCTIKTLWMWYSKTLVYLYLQLWHHREILDNQLRKLFPSLPQLQVFEFVGEIRELKTLCTMCCQIRTGMCNVKHVNLQLQDVIGAEMDRSKCTKSIECLLYCFKQDFDEMGVTFEISLYPC